MNELKSVSLTIVVPCFNEREHIEAFLASVLHQDFAGADWEIVVADGMSEDGTRDRLAAAARNEPRLRWVDNPEGIVSTGLNRAIESSHADIILRMDVHTEYARDYVRRCVETLLATGAANVGGPARTKPRGFVQRAISAAYHSPFACGGALFHDVDYRGYVDTVPYGCWMRETLLDLGLFDPGLVRNQDDELNLRTVRSGRRIWQDPEIRSWYQCRDKLGKVFRQYFQYGYWKVAVLRKHRIPAKLRHLAPAAFVAFQALIVLGVACLALTGHPWAKGIGAVWVAVTGAYVALSACFAFREIGKHGVQIAAILPALYLTFHLSYGIGFLTALVLSRPGSTLAREPRFATTVSR